MDAIRELTKANEVTVSEVTQDLFVWLLDLKEAQGGQKKWYSNGSRQAHITYGHDGTVQAHRG